MIRESLIFCLVGPAGSGKTSHMLKILDKVDNLKNSVSVTDRAPREGEVDGRTRKFVSTDDFQKMITNKEFFEYEETHGNFYGTEQATLDQAFDDKYDLIFDIDIRGALNLKNSYPDNTVIAFMVPPSLEALVERTKKRASISEEELNTRLKTAQREYENFFDNYEKIDYFIVNDQIDITYNNLLSVLNAERNRLSRVNKQEVQKICKVH